MAENTVEYRCLWEECMRTMDGLMWMPRSGRVFPDIEPAIAHMANLTRDPNMRGVHIEARGASNNAWPRPFEGIKRGWIGFGPSSPWERQG